MGWNAVSTWPAVACPGSVSHRSHLVSARGDVTARVPGRKPLSVPRIHSVFPLSYTLLTVVQPSFRIFSIFLEYAGTPNFGLFSCCCLGRGIFQLKSQKPSGNLGSFGRRSEGAGQLANTQCGESERGEPGIETLRSSLVCGGS